MVALGQDVERLRHPAKLGVDRLGGNVQNTTVTNSYWKITVSENICNDVVTDID